MVASLPGGGPVTTSIGAGLAIGQAYEDETDTHEPPTAPTQATADSLEDPESGLFKGGYFNARGMAALKYAHPTMQANVADIDSIAAGLANDRQREMFREEQGGILEQTRVRMEEHANQQVKVAQQEALKAGIADATLEVQKNADLYPNDPAGAIEGAHTILEPLEDHIRALADTPEQGDMQVNALRQTQAQNLLNRYLGNKDYKSAQVVLDKESDALRWGKGDGSFESTQRVVASGLRMQTADQLTQKLLDDSKEPNGSGLYNSNKLLSDFLALPAEQRTPEAMESLQKVMSLANEASRAKGADMFKTAESQFVTGGNQLSAIGVVY
jgi:hypothetical protein